MKGNYITCSWSLPYEYDEDETEVMVRFYYYPGDGKKPWHRSNFGPDADSELIEDVTVIRPNPSAPLPAWVMEEAEQWAWDHVAEMAEARER